MNSLDRMKQLSGVETTKLTESADASVSASDVATNPTGGSSDDACCKVPTEVTTALTTFIKNANDAMDAANEQNAENEARIQETMAQYGEQLKSLLDGTEMGFKKAGTALHSAQNFMTNALPDEVIKYLSGNAAAELNKDPINKEGIRKHLQQYVDQVKSQK